MVNENVDEDAGMTATFAKAQPMTSKGSNNEPISTNSNISVL